MLASVELVKADLIEQLLHLARQRLEPERVERASEFIRGLYEHVPPGDLVKERPDHSYSAAISLLSFAEQRTAGAPKVRLFAPRMDEHGWHSSHTVVEMVNDDMPFLVDSVSGELNRLGAEVQLVVHPIFVVERDEAGVLRSIRRAERQSPGPLESIMHIRVRAQAKERWGEIERRVLSVLEDVRLSVTDFGAMREQCALVAEMLMASAPTSDAEERDEAALFLKWLTDEHFVFQGFRRCQFEADPDSLLPKMTVSSGLGVLRSSERQVFESFQLPQGNDPVRIFKANFRSTVHRQVHLDVILVLDAKERARATPSVFMFVGLFGLSAYLLSPQSIPLLRHKIARALELSRLRPQSYDGKTLRYILQTYPRDELFQISVGMLLSIARGILDLQNRQRVAFFARQDPFNRFVSCLVYIPRDRMGTSLRLKIQEILSRAFHGSVSAYYTYLGDEPLARLHFIVKTPEGTVAHLDQAALERKLLDATRSWQDRLESSLFNELGEERGVERAQSYAHAFPQSYAERFDELVAVSDIDSIEQALELDEVTLHLYHPVEARPDELSLKLFHPGRFLSLSEVLPMLENMGLRVNSDVPYEVRPAGARCTVWIHDFQLVTEDSIPVDLGAIQELFIEAFTRVLRGTLENDAFNKLVLRAGLTSDRVNLLRAYAKYLRQARVPFSLEYMQNTLKNHAKIAKLLVELFETKLGPQSPQSRRAALGEPRSTPTRQERAEKIRAHVAKELDGIQSLEDDRILRRLFDVVDATVRTNFYQRDQTGLPKEYLAFKFDSKRISWLPAPQPFREIFVSSPRVEGVHLRFGPVARGGVRWSDRLEDFRTEVLGLAKAQQVKNAIIVPVGSKGGFVSKRQLSVTPLGRDAVLEEGIACYQTFVRGLLDLTDNRSGEQIIPPPDVVTLDDTDPYLVLAADKGTATFSDIANRIAKSYGFWLDDAFASGGSAGYDHKKIGITARGAWESVKRYFRELGKDVQNEDFTCVAVGDMSGDVFGNALLLSKHIKLCAAFNHQHIFIDPTPDPESSWHERKRLFDLGRSSWTDYQKDLLSEGGGIWSRSAKSIAVSPAVRQLLNLAADALTPSDLIVAILKAPVELLFFGGIGTFVKAQTESHTDVGDRVNDGLRIDGADLAAKVIAEGANLGMTQKARVEYALLGGRCNTDFIDNSAGVDCSDHEVNIKILLGAVEQAGDLTRKQRDELLVEMTDEVAELVLRDNYLQTQMLSVTQKISNRLTDRLARYLRALERSGKLSRALESLPDEDVIVERAKASIGFVRPELCVLLSYAKNALYEELLASSLPDEPSLEHDLIRYFPTALREPFRDYILKHRLRRELIATVVTNDMVNRMGISFAYEASETTGMPAAQIAMAYVIAREIHGMRELWLAIEALDNQVPATTQASMLLDCGRLVTNTVNWLLRTYALNLNVQSQVELYKQGTEQLLESLAPILPEAERRLLAEQTLSLVQTGVPEKLAQRVASLGFLRSSCDLVEVSRELGFGVEEVAKLYFLVGQHFGFDWLRRLAVRLPSERSWDKQAVSSVIDDLFVTQRGLVTSMLTQGVRGIEPEALIQNWVGPKLPLVTRSWQLVAELQNTSTPDFAMLAVADRQLKSLLAGR